MDDEVKLVFHGFLNLPTKAKMQMIGAINEYFDAIDREPIRKDNEDWFRALDLTTAKIQCKSCGR